MWFICFITVEIYVNYLRESEGVALELQKKRRVGVMKLDGV